MQLQFSLHPASFIGSFFFCPRFLFLAYFVLHVHLNIKICISKFCQFHRCSVYQRSDLFPQLQTSHLFQFTLSIAGISYQLAIFDTPQVKYSCFTCYFCASLCNSSENLLILISGTSEVPVRETHTLQF